MGFSPQPSVSAVEGFLFFVVDESQTISILIGLMPNHTSQVLTVTGNPIRIEELKKLVITEDSNFDHNTFFPMPEELRGTSSPVTIQTQEEIDAIWNEYNKKKQDGTLSQWQLDAGKPFGLGMTREQSNELIEKYGTDNWYDWANRNWGTKWGVYDAGEWSDSSIGLDSAWISFNSAWSPANQMIQKLSEKFPDLSFVLDAADEGGGFVCRYIISEGIEACDEFDWSSDEGIEIRQNVGLYDESEEDTED